MGPAWPQENSLRKFSGFLWDVFICWCCFPPNPTPSSSPRRAQRCALQGWNWSFLLITVSVALTAPPEPFKRCACVFSLDGWQAGLQLSRVAVIMLCVCGGGGLMVCRNKGRRTSHLAAASWERLSSSVSLDHCLLLLPFLLGAGCTSSSVLLFSVCFCTFCSSLLLSFPLLFCRLACDTLVFAPSFSFSPVRLFQLIVSVKSPDGTEFVAQSAPPPGF